MVEVEIPFEDKIIRLRIEVVSVRSTTAPAVTPTTPTVTLRPKIS